MNRRAERRHAGFAVCLVLGFLFFGGTVPGECARTAGVAWEEDRILVCGQAVAPEGAASPGAAKLLARRGAVVDLQRNLLEFIQGVKVEARTTMEDFMVHDQVRTSVRGLVRHAVILESSWDGAIYTVWGGLGLRGVRLSLAPEIKGLEPRPAPSRKGGFSGMILDLGDLSFEPSLVVSVRTPGGTRVYGPEFVDRDHFVDKGMCQYMSPSEPREPSSFLPGFFGASPAEAGENLLVISRDVHISDAGDIVISSRDAELIEKNAFDFRVPCNVTVIAKTAAARGRGTFFFVREKNLFIRGQTP